MPKSQYRPLKLTDSMPFGKHKDEQIEDIIYDDPSYMAWLVQEDAVELDHTVTELLEELKIV